MTYAILVPVAFVEWVLIAYYSFEVLNPKYDKRAVFLTATGIIGTVFTTMLILFEGLYSFRIPIGLLYVVLFLLLFFRVAYWKLFVWLFSSMILGIIAEQTVIFFFAQTITPDMFEPPFNEPPEAYLPLVVFVGVSMLLRFLLMRYIAIPIWRRKLNKAAGINALLAALFTVLFFIAVSVYNTLWLESDSDVIARLNIGALTFLGCSSAFMLLFIRFSLHQAKHEHDAKSLREQLALQATHNSEMSERYIELQKIKHDFNNHIQVLASLATQGRQDEFQQYLAKLSANLMRTEGVVFCGNAPIDAVLFHKREAMLAQNIRVEYKVALPCGHNIESIDLCCVMSNLLDNAINACLKLPEDAERFAALETKTENGFFIIVLKNSYCTAADKQRDTSGLGLKIVVEIAEKYGGGALFEPEGDIFTSVVNFKLPENEG